MNTEYSTMRDLGASLVRTLTPWIVGLLIAGLASIGIDMPGAAVEQFVVLAISAVYYIVARYLETHASSKFGWLLGLPKAPVYPGVQNTPVATEVDGTTVEVTEQDQLPIG